MKSTVMMILLILAFFFVQGAFFIVDERNQVVVTRLGEINAIINEPGLHFKLPYLDMVHFFDDRLLDYDAQPKEIITKDKKTMVIDNYAKWKIADVAKFYNAVGSEYQAQLRLDDLVYSILREHLGQYDLTQIVSPEREIIMAKVTKASDEKLYSELGINILDVRIKRADLPKENEKHIFDRMKAEREKMAMQYRAEGQEEATKIRADTDKQVQIILSEGQQQGVVTKGEGDAEALKIYADAFNVDPEFYEFYRTLQAYEQIFTTDDIVILGDQAQMFRYLKGLK
ncbi:MAG: protease modulator HflC [Candidatus Wallbacteria bacterium]|nr:protease modulator HflC [Candidatus Wallbacteria bacterium]